MLGPVEHCAVLPILVRWVVHLLIPIRVPKGQNRGGYLRPFGSGYTFRAVVVRLVLQTRMGTFDAVGGCQSNSGGTQGRFQDFDSQGSRAIFSLGVFSHVCFVFHPVVN